MTDQRPPEDLQSGWREQRSHDRWPKRDDRWGANGAWVGGTILIVLGVLLLLNNLGFFLPHNWWAVFILIPAVGSFASAWSAYQRNGHIMTASVRGGILGGVILTALAAAFFFGFDWGKYWPVILILLGIAALGGGIWRR